MARKLFLIIFTLGLSIFFTSYLNAHTYRMSLVVDTDMALDDVRALAMILNSDMVDIPLIVSSDGAVSPQAGYSNLRRLLKYFNREDINVAAGRILDKPAPRWRLWSEDLNWPDSISISDQSITALSAAEEIVRTLSTVDKEVVYLCLGPLTNLADAIRLNPAIKKKISRVIFYGTPPADLEPDWNYTRDPESADFVFKSGVDIYSLSIPEEKLLAFDQELYDRIKGLDTPASCIVCSLHASPAIKKLFFEGHFKVWDEMAVIYINHPSLFKLVPADKNTHVMVLADFRGNGLQEVYLKLFGHSADFHLSMRKAVVLNDFPDDPSLFRKDIRPHVKKIIERYGFEEWKACLLTNELHRHLGIYSIIGAKMGIRAREILEAPFDTLNVFSLAGNTPPLSCMNDGLQVSTGASLGRGTIEISNGSSSPAATFLYKNQKLTLKIKKATMDKIRADIKAALKEYGGLNPEYFAHIRKLSIDYWYELDRKNIFEEVSLLE